MADTLGTSPCSIFHYQYDGPGISYYDDSPFTILCIALEKGAEIYYSGVRVVLIAARIGYHAGFAKAEIQARRHPSPSRMIIRQFAGKPIEIGPPADKDEDYTPSEDGLPLCTLIFELVDSNDATYGSHVEIRFTSTKTSSTNVNEPVQTPDTHRVLYDYTKRTTVHSPSCILPLSAKYAELQHSLANQSPPESEWCGTHTVNPAQISLPTHEFRILPPSEGRPFFKTQPPPEVLYHIFFILSWDLGHYHNWRKELVAMGLVCRAWNVASCVVVYEDFEREGQKLHIGRLATTLEDNPMWGKYIKLFSSSCFAGASTEPQFPRHALTILKTASNIRNLSVGRFDTVLAGEFVKAFCKMTELRQFAHRFSSPIGVADTYSERQTRLDAAQLTKCFAHWPKLRQATVEQFGQPHARNNELVLKPAQCALNQIEFGRGFISMTQLRAITASSQDSLHTVVLRRIKGISNKELRSWLLDFGPNLISLTLQFIVFTRSEADELAVDATIHMMPKLSRLEVDGSVATVLTLLRFNPIGPGPGLHHIEIGYLVLPHLRALVTGLRTTKWGSVSVAGLRISEENSELVKEAKKVAKERGIYLLM